ncbi:MAG: hypothetical protein HUJ99_06500 [Bacteroidaceae bacterium]|nr:hypothetical protein [Bacteroidaceae bacterium]
MRDLSETCLRIAEVKARAVDAQSPQVMKGTVDRIHDANPITARNAAWVITHFHDVQVACHRN